MNGGKMQDPVQFFKALSDKTRLQIIALLIWKKELCVCDIENVLKLTQSKASRHLRYLLNSDILTDERKNIWVYYSINEHLPEDELDFLEVFKKVIKEESWIELNLKLEKWLKSKNNSDNCKGEG